MTLEELTALWIMREWRDLRGRATERGNWKQYMTVLALWHEGRISPDDARTVLEKVYLTGELRVVSRMDDGAIVKAPIS